jgi:hypothetical protein
MQNAKKTHHNTGYNSLLGHCRLTNNPAECSICDLFAKLGA